MVKIYSYAFQTSIPTQEQLLPVYLDSHLFVYVSFYLHTYLFIIWLATYYISHDGLSYAPVTNTHEISVA